MTKETEIKPSPTNVPDVSEKAMTLFQSSLVWDNVLPWVLGDRDFQGNADSIDRLLPRFHNAGVDLISLSLDAWSGIETIVAYIGRVRREIKERSGSLVLVSSLANIRAAKASNKLALTFHFQESLPFGSSLDMVQVFYDLGVRHASLTYNQRNLVGDGCAERTDAGLSRFGIEVVRKMNQVGMVVDGSHVGYRTTMDAMEISERPFIFSHSNPYAIHPHYRNIKDEQIKACAATGGVIGINGVGAFVGDNNASTEAIFRCVDYTVELVGAEHVGLGFDYVDDAEGAYRSVKGAPLVWPTDKVGAMDKQKFAGPEQIAELVQMMLDNGYSDTAITGILGENWARVCERVWK